MQAIFGENLVQACYEGVDCVLFFLHTFQEEDHVLNHLMKAVSEEGLHTISCWLDSVQVTSIVKQVQDSKQQWPWVEEDSLSGEFVFQEEPARLVVGQLLQEEESQLGELGRGVGHQKSVFEKLPCIGRGLYLAQQSATAELCHCWQRKDPNRLVNYLLL